MDVLSLRTEAMIIMLINSSKIFYSTWPSLEHEEGSFPGSNLFMLLERVEYTAHIFLSFQEDGSAKKKTRRMG